MPNGRNRRVTSHRLSAADGGGAALAMSDLGSDLDCTHGTSGGFQRRLPNAVVSQSPAAGTGWVCPVAMSSFNSGAGGSGRFHQPPPSAWNKAAVSLTRL